MQQISDTYHVSPQISVEDVPTLKAAGITTVICNRPDAEVPPSHQAAALQAAVEAAGLTFHVLPLTHQTMTPDNVARQQTLVDEANGLVLAYCASGTRCSVIWALGQAQSGRMTPQDILSKTQSAGYDLAGLAPTLNAAWAQSQR